VIQVLARTLRDVKNLPEPDHPLLKNTTILHLLECVDRTVGHSTRELPEVMVAIKREDLELRKT